MDKGLLVPDELTVRLLLDRVAQDDCSNGYVLDGFPRTIPQAEVLDSELTKLGDSVDYAVDVDVPDENIINRMSGRRACLNCGATYHIVSIPPKKKVSVMYAAATWYAEKTISLRRLQTV